MPSRDCVTASLMAGRCEYGSQSKSGEAGSAARAASVIARYLIGADACSSSQLNGKEMGSGTGAVNVGAGSAVILDAVTGGARHAERSDTQSRQAEGAAGSAGKNSTISVRRLGAGP